MKRWLRLAAIAMLPLLGMGCQNLRPAVEWTPVTPIGPNPCKDGNPVLVTLPATEYGRVFETVLQVLHDYGFEIAEANRYSGHIEAAPRVAPGMALFLKPGSPDLYERALATLQTYRHRVTVIIQPWDPNPADHGGYAVEFIVRKELEDLAKPIRATAGIAAFRGEHTVERQTEVIDATHFDTHWIFRGRDPAMEQELIRRYKCAL